MTQTLFRCFSLLSLLLALTMPATAAEQVYTIQKGDTLWGLSKRFISDPYYWPNMWANNPEITNPHLIFPGQKILVKDGRLEIIPAYPEAGQPEAATGTAEYGAVTAPEAPIQFKSTGSGDGFILTDEKPLGLLVDSVDNRVLLTKGDLVFVKMHDPASVSIGDTYGLFQRGADISHPVSKKKLGTMVNNLGFLQIEQITGNTATARIGDVYREVVRGAELFEYVPARKDLILQKGIADLNGHVIATRDEKLAQGTNDVIFIGLGSEDGLASGNLCYISRPRKVSDELLAQAGDVQLPDEVLGAAVIIETKARTASALIVKSVSAIFVGDLVTVAEN